MVSSLQNFLDNLRIETIIFATFAYLIILWLLVPIWIFLDSRKRFENKYIPYVFFILVFPLNIPGFIFYIIIRPDDQSDHEENLDDHILHVPVVKFLDNQEDFVMSFDLRINGKLIDQDKRSNLNMNLSIDPDEKTVMVIEESPKKEKLSDNQDKKNKIVIGKKHEKGTKSRVQKLKESFSETMREVKGFFILEEDLDDELYEEPEKVDKKNNKKKRKK